MTKKYGRQMKRNIFEGKHQSECWGYYHQVAAIQDGCSKVMCKMCDHVLSHPTDRHRGTSPMNKQYSSGVNCRRLVPRGQDIKCLLRNGVYFTCANV
ncbi:uncharacterized protein N7529_001797 [Penicillium soppii]|uniref:uncharacterized protein n=1 Tax=Penicillium soppii TaxID=69789 RepID=UPI0025480079|nr:uncharacterized protein N7529_001797 [Penicillium soppii]KAJ5876213.1 hypothetical protein N7529_001797 [Penicillium soppii]